MSRGAVEVAVASLCRALRRAGATAERTVAVALPPGPELAIALLAVLRSGAAYVPVDPTLPPARRERILAQSAPVAVVDRKTVETHLGAPAGDDPVPELDD